MSHSPVIIGIPVRPDTHNFRVDFFFPFAGSVLVSGPELTVSISEQSWSILGTPRVSLVGLKNEDFIIYVD